MKRKKQIKWSWKLRIKKNTSRIDYLEGSFRDIKSRLENIEVKIDNLEENFKLRGEGLEAWYERYLRPLQKLPSTKEVYMKGYERGHDAGFEDGQTYKKEPKDDPGMGYVVCPKCEHKWYLYGSDLK